MRALTHFYNHREFTETYVLDGKSRGFDASRSFRRSTLTVHKSSLVILSPSESLSNQKSKQLMVKLLIVKFSTHLEQYLISN